FRGLLEPHVLFPFLGAFSGEIPSRADYTAPTVNRKRRPPKSDTLRQRRRATTDYTDDTDKTNKKKRWSRRAEPSFLCRYLSSFYPCHPCNPCNPWLLFFRCGAAKRA